MAKFPRLCRAAARLVAIGLTALAPDVAEAQMMKLGQGLVLHVPDLAPGADAATFEAAWRDRVRPALKSDAPKAVVHLFRGDRGARKGQFAVAWTIDPAPQRSDSDARAAGEPIAAALDTRLGSVVKGRGQSQVYRLVGGDAVAALPDVDVLGIHFVKVKPDRREAFERFIAATVHPAVANLRPDLGVLYYRSAGGAPGDYIALFALTRASRDKYWPGGSDSDDLRAAFAPVRALTKELATYLVEGSYLADPKFAAAVYESREWADFVLVP